MYIKKLATLESWERKVDGRNGNMLVEFDGVGKCVILGRLLRKIKKYPKIKDKNFGNTKIMRIFAASNKNDRAFSRKL